MNRTDHLWLMLPYLREMNYGNEVCSDKIMIYGRSNGDFQLNCLLFKFATNNTMKDRDVARLRRLGFDVCYVYDMLDFENREFTIKGFVAINADIKRAIEAGYTHILVANAYLIELLCNEYVDQIKVIISSLLEFNSSRARTFMDVLNDSSAISHIVVSQNHLTIDKWIEMKKVFHDVQLVLEPDRWSSNIQMIHEHYYNIVYGYHKKSALKALKNFVNQKRVYAHVKQPLELILEWPHNVYKLGEINVSPELLRHNLKALTAGDIRNIKIIDFYLW